MAKPGETKKPSKGLLDFYNNQVRNPNSIWNKYVGIRTARLYTEEWEDLEAYQRTNFKKAYERFKKSLPVYKKIEQQNLISVEEAGKILGIPERRGPPTAKYTQGRMTSGFPITISDTMTRGAQGGERMGSGQDIASKILKPKFKLQQLDVGLGKGNLRWFIKDPRKVENGEKILQDYYLRKGRKYGITKEVVDRVKGLHRNPKIVKLLEKGDFENGQALAAIQKKFGWTPSESSTAVFRLAQAYNGKNFLNVDFKLPENKKAANAIFEAIERSPFGSPFHARGYQIAMDTITENLGEKYFGKGTMDSFKREIRNILSKEKIPLYDSKLPEAKRIGFNLNELVGVTPAVRSGSHPYSQFVNLMEGKFNQGHYAQYVRKLGDYQIQLQDAIQKGNPESVIKDFNKYNKNFENIYGLKKGDLPTLSLKDPTKIYSGKRLQELADQGIDLTRAFDEAKYSIDVGDAPTIKEIKEFKKPVSSLRVIDPLLAAINKAPQVCRKILNYQTGGISATCAEAVQKDPVGAAEKLKNLDAQSGPLAKVKNAAVSFLKSPGAKTFGAGAVVGTAVGLVKLFRNDDPTTYLSNEDQQKNMLVDMATQPVSLDIERPAILDYQLPALGATLAGTTALAAPSTIKASKSRALGIERKPPGIAKTGLRVLGRGLGVAASPALLAPLAAGDIVSQIAEGDSPTDIATDPLNYLYPAFADQTPKLTRGLPSAFRKVARLGLSKPALRLLSRAGIGGFAASAAIQGLGLLDD
jgi:hypothetical protein